METGTSKSEILNKSFKLTFSQITLKHPNHSNKVDVFAPANLGTI